MLLNIVLIIVGFLCLVKGGDYLVDGSTAIARKAKVSEMVIGLTIVGFGTSAPELLVSLQAALEGSSGLAIGNVVGSNIANIALILGVSALIIPLPTDKRLLRIDSPFMVLAVLAFSAVAMTGEISRVAGIVGFMGLVAFVVWQVRDSRKKQKAMQKAENQALAGQKTISLLKACLLVAAGGVLLVLGANLLIKGSSAIARQIGEYYGTPASEIERIIGLTIVAVGTSLPELFASVMAAIKGKTDMAIGNIIGSVTFNILSVIGLSSAICPIHNTNVGFLIDYAVQCLLVLVLWLFLRTNYKLERWEGVVLVMGYVAYIGWTLI